MAVSENPNSSLEDLTECGDEFTALAAWIEKETLKVLARTLTYSQSIVKNTWGEVMKIESFDRLAGLHVMLRTASERSKTDLQKVQGPEKDSLHRLSVMIDKVLRCIRKRVESLFPGEVARLDGPKSPSSDVLQPQRITV